jgi:serine/threonine protein kinase
MRQATLGKRSTGTRAFGSTRPVTQSSGVRPRPDAGISALAGRGEGCGRMLGPYELVELLGKGSCGYVYRARHAVLQRSVAIKVLADELADDASSVARFIAEARAVNLLDHSHVLDVTDIAIAIAPGEVPWFVMELLQGADLAHRMTGEPMELLDSLRIMRDVCRGLDAAHRQGIVHRDVKPENIFLARIDGRDVVKLIDFGIARLPDALSAEPVMADEIIGTPYYMAPEQTGMRKVDHRADLYAVGAVLFELLTGAPPFCADDLPLLVQRLLHEEAPLASSRVVLPKAVCEDVDYLIARCLRKEPGERPPTAQAVIAEVDRIEQVLAAAEKMDRLTRSSIPAAHPHDDRRRIAYAVAGVAALALCAALVARWAWPASARDTEPAAGATQELTAATPARPPPPPPASAAPSVLPSPPPEAAETTRATAAKRPARRAPRRTKPRDVTPQRVAIPTIVTAASAEPTAAREDSQIIRPTAPRAPQLLDLRPAATPQ